MRIVPQNDNLLVDRDTPEKQTKGGILMPENHQQSPFTGVIREVGPGKYNEFLGCLTPMNYKQGQRIAFAQHVGTLVAIDRDNQAFLITADNVLCIIEADEVVADVVDVADE